jgi:hypothetical protein
MAGTIKNLGGGVVVFENAIDVPQGEIIELLDSLSEKSLSENYEYVKNENGEIIHAKNKSGFIYELESISKTPIRIQNLNHDFFWECEKNIYSCLLQYIELFPSVLQCLWWRTEGHALKYPTGSVLGLHCDNDVNYRYWQFPPVENATRAVITALVYINNSCDEAGCDENSFSGGEMIIPHAGVTIKPKSGNIVFMPSNYLGAHEILEVTSGCRYTYLTLFSQGSGQDDKGITPMDPDVYIEQIDRPIGGQWWMKEIISDYDEYLMKKYGDEGKIPIEVMPFKSRKDDHK